MKPKLISFKICPFVQRSVITLLEKQVEYDIEYVDLENKPEWFLKISPLGKVPVVQIGDDVLFESAVINEYLDEVNPPSLHPSDAIVKAKNRAWIEFGSGLLMDFFQMSMGDEATFTEKKTVVAEKLGRIEEQIVGDYFNGSTFNLIDAAFAPFLQRVSLVEKHSDLDFLSEFPKVKKWNDTLMSLDSVKNSVVDDFEELFISYMKEKGSYISTKLA